MSASLAQIDRGALENNDPVDFRGTVDNKRMMRTWLRNCQHTHARCTSKRANFLPTRLLDLEAFSTGQDIKLVRTDSVKVSNRVEYLTLSHCWGELHTHSIKTETQSLSERMTRIPMTALSNTFKDAVQITRDLGHRYLWIDSLCIIQDDKDDWAQEAALMADVYGNAVCTLAALSSKDSTEGCHLVSDIQGTTQCSFFDLAVEADRYSRLRIFQNRPAGWETEYQGSPLSTRAWVLQERELSQRTIHFAKRQLLWECQELKATAQLSWEEEKQSTPELQFAPWAMTNKRSENVDRDDGLKRSPKHTLYHRERWYQLVEDYASRTLSYESDKLIALSGLAKHHQEVFPESEYLAGIWSAHLPAALLWQTVDKDATGYKTYIAPSWSWASVKGRISYVSYIDSKLCPLFNVCVLL